MCNGTCKCKNNARKELKYFSEGNFDIFYGTEGSAGLDLPFYDPDVECVVVNPRQRITLKTGIHVEFPENTFGFLDSRSSTSKLELDLLCRTIDGDFTGNIRLVFMNVGKEPVTIKRGDYLAQMIIRQYDKVIPRQVSDVSELESTARGHNGFGSTGNTPVK